MTLRRLALRNLWFRWRANLALLLGVALGTAVLTGSLLIGDSLRGSLRDLTLRRLGRIDAALVGDRFFPADLADRLATRLESKARHVAPAILLRGSVLVRASDGSLRAHAGQVQIVGVDKRFWPLFDQSLGDLGTEAILNRPLADELGIGVGDLVEARFDRPQGVPAESVVGRRGQPEGLLL